MFGIECRKRAPIVERVEPHHDLRSWVPVFPVMKNIDWCGEFSSETKQDGVI